MSIYIKNIQVKHDGTQFYTIVTGSLSSGFKIANIFKKLNGNTIDVNINVLPPNPNMIVAMVMKQFKKKIPLGNFYNGKYAVRINGNNKDVAWFTS